MNQNTLQEMISGNLFGKTVRVLRSANGEPLFVAKDVCDILGISNNRDALKKVFPEDKGVGLTDTLGGQQKLVTVNESGLYTLIIKSNKPEARAFQRWITNVVLPSIRKSGIYSGEGEIGQVWMKVGSYLKLRGIDVNGSSFGKSAGVRCRELGMPPQTTKWRYGNHYRVAVLDATYNYLRRTRPHFPAAKRGPLDIGSGVLEFNYSKPEATAS